MPILHDPPTIVRDGDRYYVFSSGHGVPSSTSSDLYTWFYRGAIITALPRLPVKNSQGNDGMDVWAPDVIEVDDTFSVYYAVSKMGSVASAIGPATNTPLGPKNPEYKWVDRSMALRSDGKQQLNANELYGRVLPICPAQLR